jgi:hypothetical protein
MTETGKKFQEELSEKEKQLVKHRNQVQVIL